MSYDSNAHWYDGDGKPMHQVKSADGKKMVNTTIRQARKFGLFPSVTTVLKMLAKPMLDQWKLEQVAKAAFRHPPRKDSKEYPYTQFIIDKAFEQVEEAANAGSLIHAACERMMRGLEWDRNEQVYLPELKQSFPMEVFVEPVYMFMQTYAIEGHAFEKAVVNREYGFAGMGDLFFDSDKGFGCLDYKTRKTEPGKPVRPYDEQPMQIAGYVATEHDIELMDVTGCNLYISTTEPGRIEATWYETQELYDHYHAFGSLCKVWQHFKKYDPRGN